jgi:tetraacyldisaccharide-1-P 4'-kinase
LRELGRERLERGSSSLPIRALSRVWERFANVVRPLAIPPGVQVIGVGGATLGGSGKTPTVSPSAELAATRQVAVGPARIGRVCEGRAKSASRTQRSS